MDVVFLYSGQDNTNDPSFAKGKTLETEIAQSYRGLTLKELTMPASYQRNEV